jgi:hypothetical protein
MSPCINSFRLNPNYVFTVLFERYHRVARVLEMLAKVFFNSLREDLVEIVVKRFRSLCRILYTSCAKLVKRSCEILQVSLHDLVQVLVRRSCGDPVETLLKRSLHEDLEDALHWCLYDSSSGMLIGSS